MNNIAKTITYPSGVDTSLMTISIETEGGGNLTETYERVASEWAQTTQPAYAITVAPNPTTGPITVSVTPTTARTNVSVKVYDYMGSVVANLYSGNIAANETKSWPTTIPSSHPGTLFYVVVTDAQYSYSKQFVKTP